MSESFITQHTIQPRDIVPVVQDIEDALDGHPREACIIGMLSIILIMQHPEITQEKLHQCVNDVSRYICLVLDTTEPKDMN